MKGFKSNIPEPEVPQYDPPDGDEVEEEEPRLEVSPAVEEAFRLAFGTRPVP